jgi:hypothetical protein
MLTEPCCNDVAVHCHDGVAYKSGRLYTYRHAFEWRRPKAVIVHTADPMPLAVLNRYPGCVIGVCIRLRRRTGLSVLWGRPGRIIDTSPHVQP